MRRLRLAAAALAILTALVDWLLALDPAIGGGVVALTALSAACLAAFTPFDTLEPAGRRLVFAACSASLVGVSAAFALATRTAAELAPLASLGLLVAGGAALAVWSFAIRNRRRRSGWRNYYDS